KEIDPAGALKHIDRHQHRDEERNDPKNHAEAFLGPLNKLIINLQSAERAVENEEGDEQGNSEERQRAHAAHKVAGRQIRVGRRTKSRRKNVPNEKDQKENKKQREHSPSPSWHDTSALIDTDRPGRFNIVIRTSICSPSFAGFGTQASRNRCSKKW